jgi:probable F420-dependent oxidoreductase
MKFGLSIPTLTGFERELEPQDGGWKTRWDRSYELCELAEELGFDFGTIGHHRFTPTMIDSAQPMVTLAALAARTKTLRLCTNIAILPLFHPLDFAEQAATVEEISNGRLILGLAIGYRPHEFEQNNMSYKDRVSRFEEVLEVVRLAWRDEPVNFEGKYFTVKGADVGPKPIRKPGPPIWMGAQVDAAIARAARLSDGWLTDNIESAASLAPKIARFREASHAAGNAGTVVVNRKVGIAPTRAQVESEWLPPILNVFKRYVRNGAPFDPTLAGKLTSGAHIDLTDFAPGQSVEMIAGTPEDCIASIRACAETTGCDYMIVDFGRGAHGEDYRKLRDQIELFGREVIPAFA